MAEGAAYLVDHLLPRDADYRQWTLSLPHGLRARALRDKSLVSAVLAVFVRSVFADLRRHDRELNIPHGISGAVTSIQFGGSFATSNLHFHPLVPEGVWQEHADGTLWIGTRTHNWGGVMFARRGGRARMWRAPVEMGVTRAAPWPGIGALVHDLERVMLAREDGGSTEVPISLEGRTVGCAKSWGDGMLVGLHGPKDADEYFTFVYVGPDGTVRFRGSGGDPTPIDDDTMIAYDARGVQAITRSGGAAGRLEVRVGRNRDERRPPFARVDDELVFVLDGKASGLVRWHPRVDAPRWTSVLSTESESLVHPVRVGRFIAVTSSVYSEPEAPRVWLVDAETGVLEHAFEIKKPPTYLLPVGDDALVSVAFSKQPTAWRSLSTEPERLLLVHPSKCGDAVSPAPGVVVTSDGNGLNYFDL